MTTEQKENFLVKLQKDFEKHEEEGLKEMMLLCGRNFTSNELELYKSIYGLGFQKARAAASHLMDVRIPNDK